MELTLAAICAVSTLAFRGLYDGPPLLMSVGLGSMTAFGALQLFRLGRDRSVRFHGRLLKEEGRLRTGGRIFAVAAALWLAFTAHSGFVQWHRAWGRHHLERTEAPRPDVLSGASLGREYSERHRIAAELASQHYSSADRWGLVGVVEIKLGLAWVELLRGEVDSAIAHVRAAVALAPDQTGPRESLVELLLARGRTDEAADALEEKLARPGGTAEDHFRLAGLLLEGNHPGQAVVHYRKATEIAPDNPVARYNHGGLLRRLGRVDEAIGELEAAARLAPLDPDTQVELGLARRERGEFAAAALHFRRAIELAPERPESRYHLPELIRSLEETPPDRDSPSPP